MLNNLASLIAKSITSTQQSTSVQKAIQPKSYNPFSENENVSPFLSQSFGSSKSYGKNQPVAGGYFAGYYNGVPNIVGRKLFIEV